MPYLQSEKITFVIISIQRNRNVNAQHVIDAHVDIIKLLSERLIVAVSWRVRRIYAFLSRLFP